MTQPNISEYEFYGFPDELEDTGIRHSHIVRRESNTTYRDEFALAELDDINDVFYKQVLSGWSRSYYDHDEHMRAIRAYGTPDIPITALNVDVYKASISEVQNRLHSLPSVRAFDVLTELDQVPYKQSSAAGYDYIGEKGILNGVNHDRAIRRAKAMMWSVFNDGIIGMKNVVDTSVPDVGYTRTQLTDITDKLKVRNVWGRAFHNILIEGVTAEPLMRLFKSNKTFYHIGRDPLDSVPDALSEVNTNAKWIYAIDWKQFDATVSRFEIQSAFDILKYLLVFPNYHSEITFEISRQLFIHKKIAAPDGLVYWSHKGIPSGSYFTSIIGSIVNRIRIEYLWRMITGHSPIHCYTQGDDSLCSDNIFIPPEVFAEIANEVGWTFNPEKTEYSTIPEEVSFLGRTFKGGLNTRETKKCLRLLVFPEYPVLTGRISAYRAQSIAEDAGHLSEKLNRVAYKLHHHYGTASEDEVPIYFRRYVA